MSSGGKVMLPEGSPELETLDSTCVCVDNTA